MANFIKFPEMNIYGSDFCPKVGPFAIESHNQRLPVNNHILDGNLFFRALFFHWIFSPKAEGGGESGGNGSPWRQ